MRLNLDIRHVGTPRLTWRRLRLLVDQLVADRTAATYRAMSGPAAAWHVVERLMTRAIFALEVANWQRGADEKEHKTREYFPELITVPGEDVTPDDGPTVGVADLLAFKRRHEKREAAS